MRQFTYAVRLTPDRADGGYVVTCRDLPEAITQGESIQEALTEAADCLEEAIAGRMDDRRDIPEPSVPLIAPARGGAEASAHRLHAELVEGERPALRIARLGGPRHRSCLQNEAGYADGLIGIGHHGG
jgi:predicted RNase H-like HicB family nuclease